MNRLRYFVVLLLFLWQNFSLSAQAPPPEDNLSRIIRKLNADIFRSSYRDIDPDELFNAAFDPKRLQAGFMDEFAVYNRQDLAEALQRLKDELKIDKGVAENLFKIHAIASNLRGVVDYRARHYSAPGYRPWDVWGLTEAELEDLLKNFKDAAEYDPPTFSAEEKIAMLQIGPVVGDFQGTFAKIEKLYQEALKNGATMVVLPEMVFPGYPAMDLLVDRPELLRLSLYFIDQVKALTQGKDVPIVIGHLAQTPDLPLQGSAPSLLQGRKLQNVVSVLAGGELVFRQAKQLLPTYGPFDELRYFEPGERTEIFRWKGRNYAVLVCEDLWYWDDHNGRIIYKKNPLDAIRGMRIDGVLSLSASPFSSGGIGAKSKLDVRREVHAAQALRLSAPLLWVNQAQSTHGMVFDGHSFVLAANGAEVFRAKGFDEGIVYVNLNGKTPKAAAQFPPPRLEKPFPLLPEASSTPAGLGVYVPDPEDQEMENILQAILMGIRDYTKNSGFDQVVLGLSGGVDSSVTAALAVMALGSENVHGITMPSKFSPSSSVEDATLLAKALGMWKEKSEDWPSHLSGERFGNFWKLPLEENIEAMRKLGLHFTDGFVAPDGTADENIQARLRMVALYYFANSTSRGVKRSTAVLTTGCKSEISVGWCTKYGDAAGDFNPVGDLYKTEEILLGKYINKRRAKMGLPPLIPSHILDKPASPDLRRDQLTNAPNSIPPYDIFDRLLFDFQILGLDALQLDRKYRQTLLDRDPRWSQNWVFEVLAKVVMAQQKRQVSPVVVKVSRKSVSQTTETRWPLGIQPHQMMCPTLLAAAGGAEERWNARP